jgi:hypothetical protein
LRANGYLLCLSRHQIGRAKKELEKARREREAVDKGDNRGQKWERRKEGTIRVGYINADGTRDKAELIEMCKEAKADVYTSYWTRNTKEKISTPAR